MKTLQLDFSFLLGGLQGGVGVGEVSDALGNLVKFSLGHFASLLKNVDLRPELLNLASQHSTSTL